MGNKFTEVNRETAEKMWDAGESVYTFHEMDEIPFLVENREILNVYSDFLVKSK